jgi:hypothetical protein
MCVLLAAFDLLNARPDLGFRVRLEPVHIFAWLSTAGCLGSAGSGR